MMVIRICVLYSMILMLPVNQVLVVVGKLTGSYLFRVERALAVRLALVALRDLVQVDLRGLVALLARQA